MSPRLLAAVLAAAAGVAAPAAAQAVDPWLRVRGQAIPAWTRVDPLPGGEADAELRVAQPVVMLEAGAWGPHLRLRLTANLEGRTIADGELTPGAWGEGFFDRRHPHTYLHEAMLSAVDLLGAYDGAAVLSLSAGKGFVPFGTDDPMSRPPYRYPVNHHLSQILERAVVAWGLRAGPLLAEVGWFNGDEPTRPDQSPKWSRFGDSWSGRLTVAPVAELELQGSFARVTSPEHRPGAGPVQRKWNLSARWAGPVRGQPLYVLLERARTSEIEGFFVYNSVLGELAWSPGRLQAWYRFERTERPEEARTLSPYRAVRPHHDNSIIGITRWTVHTLGTGLTLGPWRGVRVSPFGEVTRAGVARAVPGLFDPEVFYGRSTIWAVTVGVRLDLGMQGHRMGRYGAAEAGPGEDHQHRER